MKWPSYVAADSGCAELDGNFNAKNIIATAAVFVEYPYRAPTHYICMPEPFELDSPKYIEREMKLAYELAIKYKPKFVHIDISLGGMRAVEISKEKLENLRISQKGKMHLLESIDMIRHYGKLIEENAGSQVILIGKQSLIVRIAELTAGACAVKYGVEKALERGEFILGLPYKCSITIGNGYILARSLLLSEQEILGHVKYSVPKNIVIEEFINPSAQDFRVLRIYKK